MSSLRGSGGIGGGGGGSSESGGSSRSGSRGGAVRCGVSGGGQVQLQRRPHETLTPQRLRECSCTFLHCSPMSGGSARFTVRFPPPLVLDELACISGQGRERYFLLVVDDYSHYTTVFPLRTKGEVPDVLIPWIGAVRLQLRERFHQDLPVLRLHSDRSSDFSSHLLRDFCRGEGILQSFTLPASPQQNGIAERRIGLVMEGRLAMRRDSGSGAHVPLSAIAPRTSSPLVPFPASSLAFPLTGLAGTSRRVFPSQDVTFDESVPFYRLFPYRTAPSPPPRRSSSLQPFVVTGDSGAAGGGPARGAASGGAEPERVEPGGAEPAGAEPGGAEPRGAASGGAELAGVESGSPVPGSAASAGGPLSASPQRSGQQEPLSPQQLREWFAQRTRLRSRAAGDSGAAGGGAARGTASGGAEPAGAEPGGVEPERAEPRNDEPVRTETERAEPGGAEPGGAASGSAEPSDSASAGGLPGVGLLELEALVLEALELEAVELEAPEVEALELEVLELEVLPLEALELEVLELEALELEALELEVLELEVLTLEVLEMEALELEALELEALELEALELEVLELEVLELEALELEALELEALELEALALEALVLEVLSLPSSTALPHGSPLPAPSRYTQQPVSLTKRREPATHPVSPVRAVRTARRVPCPRPPPVPGTHTMALRPSSAPQRVPLPSPPASSLPELPDPESDRVRAASPTFTRLLATVVTDPSFESTAASALVAKLVDFAAACRLDYAASLVAESESVCPPSVGVECALGTDVLEDRQEDFESLAAAVPHLVAWLLAPEGDPDALDIPTPRSYVEAISGPYSSQWQTAMDAEMASWKSTGTYVDEGVDFFQTFSPTPKMTTLRVLLHVAAQRDYELHSLDFSTAFLQGSLHEEIWLRRPPGFTGTFPPGTQWSLWRPVYGHCQAPHEWHDTLRTTLAALGFAPSTADPSLFLRRRRSTSSCMGLVLGGRGDVVLIGHSDASWVDDLATQRSSQGYTFSLGSDSVSWWATRSSSVLNSSCEAEIYAAAMAAQELRWLTYLLTDLGERPCSPPVLYVDNKAALALCEEHRLEHRTKHIALRYFLAREVQQRGQLPLSYVDTLANTADVFTKALPPSDHQRHCTALGLVPTFSHLLTA
ncbi:unnamed protein product [Closterium sp. Yama58-4]|nr:unnamed protein product [Closterium sp. Yama58-4]